MKSRDDITKLIHNLRNQLNNISLNADLAKLELPDGSGSEPGSAIAAPILECLDAIQSASVKCADIADDLAAITSMDDLQ